MSQCEEYSGFSIRCVMEAGHPPLGTLDGVTLEHNFGGLGPYTPTIGVCRLVPPRPPEIVTEEALAMGREAGRPTLTQLVRDIEDLLPNHAARGYSFGWKWTTRVGLWRLGARGADLGYHPAFTLEGPYGKWQISDHGFEHVRSVLIVLGAIEEGSTDEGR
jgi:hypothetical protein